MEPQGTQHFDGLWAALANEESRRLTGTHATFTPEQTRSYLGGLSGRHDRADWAIIRTEDELYLGEIVLNELDADNESMNLRIALGVEFGRGYGTEATRATVAYGLDVVGLHRISLEVYAFNPKGQAGVREMRVHPGRARSGRAAMEGRMGRRHQHVHPRQRPEGRPDMISIPRLVPASTSRMPRPVAWLVADVGGEGLRLSLQYP